MKSYYNCTTPADWNELVAGWKRSPDYSGGLEHAAHGSEIPYGKGDFENVISLERHKNNKRERE